MDENAVLGEFNTVTVEKLNTGILLILVVGELIELVDHYSFRAIRFDHRYFFLYSINRYKVLYMLVNCF